MRFGVPEKLSFEIKPCTRQDGFTLVSTSLLFPLWYTTLNGAISYARFLGRELGCRIQTRNTTDEVIDVIEIDPRFSRRLNRQAAAKK